jgi:serine-type D-Ala-D-Ala carboxypeptidase/endopeptidase (penicillin-binding protein 4)
MFRATAASTHLSSRTDARAVGALGLAIAAAACHAAPRPAVAPAPRAGSATVSLVQLQRDIDAVLAVPALDRSYWGILVRSAATGDTLYSLNAGKLLMPGSTLKIVTLAAAADRLGWDYAYDTRLVATGSIDAGAGILSGDLLVVGSGDPSIMAGDRVAAGLFAEWAERLKANGVRTIDGRIIGDDNAFDDEALGPGWAWDDLQGRDAAGISGLQYNENMVQATIAPGATGGARAIVTFAPDGSNLDLDNQLTTIEAGTAPAIAARRSPGSNRLELRGSVPLDGQPVVRLVSVDNPTLFFVAALRDALIAAGIDVRGSAVDIDDLTDAPSAADGTLIAGYRSPPLSTLAMRLMKNSQNLYAETLLKTIGGTTGAPTFENGRRIAGETLIPWGVAAESLVQVDGSGLSRYNYLTPQTLVTLLMHINQDDRLRLPFEASLPIAGLDGTLATRMKGTAAEGNARAKSGTLANVRSLAGYVTTADGQPLIFAIIANNFGTMPEVAIAAIDAIVVRLAEFRR